MDTPSPKRNTALPLILALLLLTSLGLHAQTTVFTYQGHLMDGAASANGNYDIQFRLLDADTGGSDVGAPRVVAPVNVVNGIFTVELNFGQGPFSGSDRWLEMGVRPYGSTDPYTVLAPRQKLTSAPYAVRALNATNAFSLIGPVSGANIPAGTITGSMIAPGTITSSQIAPGTINPTVGVNSASQTAAPGTVYDANHYDLATFNLPASANVGDLIGINGVGIGGWSTAAAWMPRDSGRSWTSIACSADGQRLVATATSGQIYTSGDMGVSWTPRDSNRNWQSVASSADGAKLVAVVYEGQVYTSPDYGGTWIPRPDAGNRFWGAVASSADGTRLIAVAQFGSTGEEVTSADSGATWTVRSSAGSRPWKAVASSADGLRLVAVAGTFGGGQIYTSQDGGSTWTARESVRNWKAVACSADGSFIVAADSGGQIYKSRDAGATWSASGPNLFWTGIDCSADGRVIICAGNEQIYVSVDYGQVWTAQESVRSWWDVACSADGSKRAACVIGGQIYTSYGGFSDGAGTTTRLRYIGDGIWTQVSDASATGKVNRGGDTMTGPLTLPANGLAIGGSQLTMAGGVTGIGTTAPEPGFTLTLGGTPVLASLDGLLMLRDRSNTNHWHFLLNSAGGDLFLTKIGGGFLHAFQASGNVGIKTDSPTATLDVNGITHLRDVAFQGSLTGTGEAPSFGIITRRINSTRAFFGEVVARTPVMSLERDANSGGWFMRITGATRYAIAAMGMNSAGNAVNYYASGNHTASVTLFPIYDNAQDVVFFRVQFGDPYNNGHHTEVTLSREAADFYWTGTMTSTFNQ